MSYLFKIIVLTPFRKFNEVLLFISNFISLKFKKVDYTSFPKIMGILYIKNNGKCSFGDNLRFNSSIKSNFVGLNKPCTIAVTKGATLSIGNNSGFSGVSIYCENKITIGNNVNCGGNVSIWDTDFHPLDFQDRRAHNLAKISTAPIKIGDDVFIGANSIILKGVTIGDRAIIGAGSIVTKSIPMDEIWAGNPAKFIRKLK